MLFNSKYKFQEKVFYLLLFFNIEDKIAEVEKLYKRICIRLEEIGKKTDTIILNQKRLNRFLLPNEKRLQKPINLPALPVSTEDDLHSLETFLEDDSNLAALVS